MVDRSLLDVDSLTISFPDGMGGEDAVVKGISFGMGVERLGLVGESGSGKSITARALMGLVRSPGRVVAKHMSLEGTDLRALKEREWAALRGTRIGMVLQDPKYSLNPVHTVGRQIEETLLLHGAMSKAERRDKVMEMVEAVGLADPARVYQCYPGELSGGMGQRVMLAAMLINGPRLLIADEPTSALDQNVREQVLDLMVRLTEQRKMGLLLISHDLQQVSKYCHRVLVMYRGRLLDECAADELAASDNPYTKTLWACRPSSGTYGTRLPVLDRDALEDLR